MAFNTAYVVLSDRTTSPLYSQYQILLNQSAASTVPIGSEQHGATTAAPNVSGFIDCSDNTKALLSKQEPVLKCSDSETHRKTTQKL